jgi:deoxycytidylate deaminase
MWTQTILKRLLDETNRATPIRGSRHAAALVSKGRIFCVGHNQLKTHPIMLRYHKPGQFFLHAEADAIAQGIRMFGENLSDFSLYVLRVTGKSGIIGNSKPCRGCSGLIDSVGITEVTWTN